MNGSWNNPYDKPRSDINDSRDAFGRRVQDQHPTVFPRVSIYSRADKSLYCVTCKHQSNTNMEHVAHLQSEDHMTKLYKYKGDKEQKRMRREGYVKKENKTETGETEDAEGKKSVESRKRKSGDESGSDERSRSKSRSKKSKKRSKSSKKSKKKKKKRYSSSSDSYSDSDSDAADREARYDAEKRNRKLSRKFGGGSKTAGLAAEVRIAVAQAEARARDLQRDIDDKDARKTNVFGKAQDRIKAEAEKEWGVAGVKTEADLLTFSEHKSQRKVEDDEDDFCSTMVKDKDLMDEDFNDEEDKDEIMIIPDKVENKPRTKLSFIAPRIPVNRKAGFGQATFQSNQGAINPVRNAGGIKMAAGGAGVQTSAAFAGSNVFATVTDQEQARHLQAEIAAGLTGTSEIHEVMEQRKREQLLMGQHDTKSDEMKLKKNAIKMSILDTFKQLTLQIPPYAQVGLEPIPCGMAMPGYAYDVGEDGNEVGDEIDGHDDFDYIDIRVY